MSAARYCRRGVWLTTTTLLLLLSLLLLYGTATCDAKNVCDKRCKCLGGYVDCSRKSFRDFPDGLPPWTEDLDLNANKIGGTLNIDIGSKIITLKLSKNLLTSFPLFVNKTRINHLNLAHNKIDRLDDFALENLPYLKNLDMNKNKLVFLGHHIFPRSNHLRVLILSNNFISNLSSDCFNTLTYLVELKISHNRLHHLPNGLFENLINLEFLDISRNHLTVIEGLLFKDLGNLKTMILRHNNIIDLQDGSFYGLSNLKQLHLEGNSISKISKGWLYGLNKLLNLNISFNKIDQIVGGWEYCGHLEELDLSDNKLQHIEKHNLENLRKLQKLFLNNNRLSFIGEGTFNNTPLIRVLKMDFNHLAWMIEDAKEPFVGLTNLAKLSLVNNSIMYIKKESFDGLDNLDELNLLENDILEIEEEAFNSMPNLVYLYLNSSSLVCDCSLSWIKEQKIIEQLPFDFVNLACGFPEKNRGKGLNEVAKEDFVCPKNSPKPVVVFHPESNLVLEKQNITLKCGVNSSSAEKMNFVWKKDNHNLDMISSNHYSIFEVNGSTQYSFLNLYNISMEQNGKYQCVASNEFGITYSNCSTLSVVVFPFFAKIPVNSSVIAGQTATLECAATGFPPPQISWQKDGGNDFPAAQERRMKVMAKDDAFLIVDVKLVDMGVYSCTAKNIAGMISTNATLTVLEPPWFGNIMTNKEVKVGEEVVLECLSNGHPKPKIIWKKDGNLLEISRKHYFTTNDQLLVIMETNTDDSGTYQCEIVNSVGTSLQEVEVVILPFYRSLIHKHTLGVIVGAVILCIAIMFAFWMVFIRKAKHPSAALINNVDNKSLNSTNSKDSGTGESTKRSQEQLYNECLNPCQQLHPTTGGLSHHEITLPLIADGTVVLGENSVFYKNSTSDTSSIQSPVEKPLEPNIED